MGVPYEDDDDRRGHLETFGEDFSIARSATKIRAEFFEPFSEITGNRLATEMTSPRIRCLTSDVALHGLVKKDVITRDSTGQQFMLVRFENDGGGLTYIPLGAA